MAITGILQEYCEEGEGGILGTWLKSLFFGSKLLKTNKTHLITIYCDEIMLISVRLQPKPSQVKPKTGCKSATALPIVVGHILLHVCIYKWTNSNAYISVNFKDLVQTLDYTSYDQS